MISYLFSIFGIFTLLIGALSFFLLPIIPKVSGEFKALARFYLWLMTNTLQRGAFVVSEHGDVLLKRMSFDDRGVERMKFDDGYKDYEDPDQARHYWYGIPFALALEDGGVLFDPRHAAIGARKRAREKANELFYKATESENDQYEVMGWVRGVFELPKHTYELVDLQSAKQLLTGIEKADHPEAVETFREYAEEPYKSGTSASRLIMLIAAILGPFLGIAIVVKYVLGSGGAGAPDRSIGFGSLLWVMVSTAGLSNIDYKRVLVAGAVVVVSLLPFGVIAALAGPLTALWAFLTFALGFVLVAVFILLLGRVIGGIPRLMLKLGFLGYDRPVLEWTPKKYRLREYRRLDDGTDEPIWYNVGGNVLGFTYTPGAASFASANIPAKDIEDRQELSADGGSVTTNLPVDMAPYTDIQRAGYLAAFVPQRTDDDTVYVDTATALESFTYAAVGLKSHRFLTRAKQKYGGESGIEEKTFVYAVGTLAAVSFFAGVGVFFVL